jgi:hypothetical protein
MRVRVSLDFDISIESFISLCIIETVGAIFREYKPWIVSATCTLDETDKHFSHKLLLYFAFFVKWVKSLTYLRNAKSL